MKKNRLIVLLVVVILVLFSAIYLLSQKNTNLPLSTNKYTPLTKDIRQIILAQTNGKPMSSRLEIALKILEDPTKTDEEKYKAISDISFYFAAEYTSSYDPTIRTFVSEKLGPFAKANFGKYYQQFNFIIPCADPTCGNDIDTEGQKIMDQISLNENIDSDYKRVILNNLKTAFYIPDDNLENKQFALRLVIEQLQFQNNNEASQTAELIKTYFTNKYKINL